MKGDSKVEEIATTFVHIIIFGTGLHHSDIMVIFVALISEFVRKSMWLARKKSKYYVGDYVVRYMFLLSFKLFLVSLFLTKTSH